MRKKKLFLNTGCALINQVITLICGFILPRQILLHFGSDINGLVSSITQFLGFITLMDMGVGAVVQSTLYRPLAENKREEINQIIASANRFFSKIAFGLLGYTAILMLFYPLWINRDAGFLSTSVLVAAISISTVAQYFFGITNQLLLNADQRSYVQLLAQSVATILNTIVSVVLISYGASINIVKLGSSISLLFRPLFLCCYVKKNYQIDTRVKLNGEPIRQKWNGMAQHLATFVVDRTDVTVLTLLSTLKNVSIYYVYHLVVAGLYQLFITLTTGVQALLGDMYAKGEHNQLYITFNYFEWLAHSGVIFLFSCAGVLMLPFVSVYTKGIDDANYIMPAFSWILTLAYAICCLRGFYNIIIKAVGHYKETQNSAIIEAIINIVVSIALVWKFGLIGVAIGTFLAMSYRTVYFAVYLKRNILNRSLYTFFRQILIDCLDLLIVFYITRPFGITETTYLGFFLMASKVGLISLAVTIIINCLFYREYVMRIVKRKK